MDLASYSTKELIELILVIGVLFAAAVAGTMDKTTLKSHYESLRYILVSTAAVIIITVVASFFADDNIIEFALLFLRLKFVSSWLFRGPLILGYIFIVYGFSSLISYSLLNRKRNESQKGM